MHITHKKWLNELEDEISIVYSEVAKEEANGNLVTFVVTAEVLNEWGADSIDAFIKGCRDLYASRNTSEPMWFYSWYDQQASQLRVGAISQRHEVLPFGCDLNLCELQAVIRGLFNSDSGLFTSGRLNVWQSNI
ncbi:MAG: hypothetical protein GY777_20700 [Candidatus Brocadiaceae bacterium]|nr:hypothetical protein [Candidatus Brocadiaceae bacterium]